MRPVYKSFVQTIFSRRFLVVVFVTAIIGLASSTFAPSRKISGQTLPNSCPTCAPPEQQTIYAPTIGLAEATGSEIVLNCRSAHVMDVTPTFYTANGQAITGATFQMQPSEMRFVTVESLIPEAERGQHIWGGMSLSYFGGTFEMWAQITLHGLGGGGSGDVTFSVLNNRGTDVQEALWYMPSGNSKAIIALGNSSNSTIHTTVQFSDGSQEVDIAPYATKYIRRQNSNTVKLTTVGPAGSLKATGVVFNANKKFTSSIRFYETQATIQPNLYATNFKVKNRASHLFLKNTTAANITIQPRFYPMEGAGTPFELPQTSLNPNQIIELDLTPLITAAGTRTDLETVSVQIVNNGTVGSLIGALYSSEQNTGILTQDIPLRDSGRLRNSTGAYPWRLDNDYSSVVSITNVGNQTARFSVKIYFDGGTYTPKPQELTVGQTASYDIRKLRDQRIPDERGNLIPLAATVGQFSWSILGPTDGVRLNGRSEVVSRSRRTDASYSCPVCCPLTGPIYSVNGGVAVYVDGFINNGVNEGWWDCYGRDVIFDGTIPGLHVVDEEMATSTMMQTGLMKTDGWEPGVTSWSSDIYNWYFFWDDGMDCYPQYDTAQSQGPVEVRPNVNIDDFKAVGKDQTASIKVTVTGNSNNSDITLTLEPNTQTTGTAHFTNTNSNTRTIQQTTNVEIKGITESSTKDNMRLIAKFNNNQLDDEDFTVISVTLSLRFGNNDDISDDNGKKQNHINATGRSKLGGPFFANGQGNHVWGHAIEIVGAILPANYSGDVVLQREVVASKTYQGSTLINSLGCVPPVATPCDDTSPSDYIDTTVSSQGNVYDLDNPGFDLVGATTVGTIRRKRTNFRQWATVSQKDAGTTKDVRVSSDITWFHRLSVEYVGSPQTQLNCNVTNDCQIGSGTTLLTWNLTP